MTFPDVLAVLGSGGGLAVLLAMAAAPFVAELLLPAAACDAEACDAAACDAEAAVPARRTAADPVRGPVRAA